MMQCSIKTAASTRSLGFPFSKWIPILLLNLPCVRKNASKATPTEKFSERIFSVVGLRLTLCSVHPHFLCEKQMGQKMAWLVLWISRKSHHACCCFWKLSFAMTKSISRENFAKIFESKSFATHLGCSSRPVAVRLRRTQTVLLQNPYGFYNVECGRLRLRGIEITKNVVSCSDSGSNLCDSFNFSPVGRDRIGHCGLCAFWQARMEFMQPFECGFWQDFI